MQTIRELREQAGILTREEFATKLRVSMRTIENAEKGRSISKNVALRIADLLSTPPGEISDLNYRGKRSVGSHVSTEIHQ